MIIRKAELEKGRIVVQWADGHRSNYHSVWLRHPAFPERANGDEGFTRPERPEEIAAASVELTPEGGLRVSWFPDGVSADYEAAWLPSHCCSASERAQRRRAILDWDTSIAKSPPQVSYDMACASDEGRLELDSRVRHQPVFSGLNGGEKNPPT